MNGPNPTQLESGRSRPAGRMGRSWPAKTSLRIGPDSVWPKKKTNNRTGPETRPSIRTQRGRELFSLPLTPACRTILHAGGKKYNKGPKWKVQGEKNTWRRRCCWSSVRVGGAAAEVGGSKRRFPTVRCLSGCAGFFLSTKLSQRLQSSAPFSQFRFLEY